MAKVYSRALFYSWVIAHRRKATKKKKKKDRNNPFISTYFKKVGEIGDAKESGKKFDAC